MITEEDIILNQIESYEDYYCGLSFNQEILTQIGLEQGVFNTENVETLMSIFLLEKFDDENAYYNGTTFVNKEYVQSHPQILREFINEHKNKY